MRTAEADSSGVWALPLFDNEAETFLVEIYQRANMTVLSGDFEAAVCERKAKPGGELQVHGSGNLGRWLLDNDLVDEITPAHLSHVVGQGTRLFPATSSGHSTRAGRLAGHPRRYDDPCPTGSPGARRTQRRRPTSPALADGQSRLIGSRLP